MEVSGCKCELEQIKLTGELLPAVKDYYAATRALRDATITAEIAEKTRGRSELKVRFFHA